MSLPNYIKNSTRDLSYHFRGPNLVARLETPLRHFGVASALLSKRALKAFQFDRLLWNIVLERIEGDPALRLLAEEYWRALDCNGHWLTAHRARYLDAKIQIEDYLKPK